MHVPVQQRLRLLLRFLVITTTPKDSCMNNLFSSEMVKGTIQGMDRFVLYFYLSRTAVMNTAQRKLKIKMV